MKVAVLGGGGFRTPLLYRSLVTAEFPPPEQIILHDVDAQRMARIRSVIRGMAEERGDSVDVGSTTRLEEALEGARFVFCAIRVGGLEARVTDERVPLELGVLGQETVGPGGICFALRTLPAMLDIARAVQRWSPGAWFLNFTNPAGLVTEALRATLGDRAIGICDSPHSLCRRVAAVLGRDIEELRFDYFGLNHLGWLRAVMGTQGDLLPALLADDHRLASLEEARLFGPSTLREMGMIPNEYLAYYQRSSRIRAALERAGETRAEFLLRQQRRFYDEPADSAGDALESWRRTQEERNRTYMAEARPEWGRSEGAGTGMGEDEDRDDDAEEGYGRVAAKFLAAVCGNTRDMLVLNVANRSSLRFLDADAVVEVPCVVAAPGAVPVAVGDVPEEQRGSIERMKEVETLTIRAALSGSADLALEAMAAHPLVDSRDLAERILDAYFEGHPSMRERFA